MGDQDHGTGGAGRRKLSLADATLLVMGGIVGVGIFFTPRDVAALVPVPWLFLTMWILGAGIALCGAATFAELGGTFPRSGGWFEFLREIYGPFVAFLFAWMILGVVSTGAIAVIASFGAGTLVGLLPGLAGPWSEPALGAAIILVLTGITLGGIKLGATFQNLCMLTKLVAIAALVVAGLVFFSPGVPAAEPPPPVAVPESLWAGAIAATLPVLFSFGGWQQVCYVAGEVEEPSRNVPRAILLGVVGVAVTYLLVNAAYLRVLGTDGLAADPGFAAEVARLSLGERGERALRAAMAVSAIGVCAVNIIVTPGIYVGMARSGLFFKSFGRLHARTGAPVLALCTQAALALAYLGWSHAGSETMDTDTLTGSVVFAEWIFHGLVALGLMLLRARRPELPRPYRSLAYPLAPALYLVTATLVVFGNLWASPFARTGIGLGVLLAGALVYRPWRAYLGAREP